MSSAADFDPRFSLKELVEASGINDRNIRYYIEQELLPPASGRGRSAYYTSQHLERLARVVDLREQGLSIDEIRVLLRREAAPAEQNPEIWEHIILHPELQIQLRRGAPEHVHAFVAEITQLAARWFDAENQQPE